MSIRKTVSGIALALLLVVPAISHAATTISAGSAVVGVGDVFTIPISIADAQDLTSWQFDLSFDPAIIHANSITEGPFMSSFGTTLFIPGVIDNGTGLISLTADLYVDLPPNPSGSGVLANVEFQALTLGTSPLTLSNVFLNLSGGEFDVVNGEVIVTQRNGAAPEASTLSFVIIASAALALRRVRAKDGCVRGGSKSIDPQ